MTVTMTIGGARFIFARRGAVLTIVAVVLRVLRGRGMLATLADLFGGIGAGGRRGVECEGNGFGRRRWL